jgi:hypothetical protein
MPQELELRRLPQAGSGESLESVLPASPERVFSLVIDYTLLSMDELKSIRTIIGGGNGPVVKLDPQLLLREESARQALVQLVKSLQTYPCTMLFLLVPCEMPGIESVAEVMEQVAHQRPFVNLVMGGSVYSWEMAMPIKPRSERDAEMREDAELNSALTQWTTRQPWFGEDIGGMIEHLEGML